MNVLLRLICLHSVALALSCYPSFAHASSQLSYIAGGVNSSGEIVGAVCPGGVPYGGGRACIATDSQGLTELVPSSAAMSVNGVVQQLDVGGCGFAADNEFGTIATAVSESGAILVEGSGPIDVYSTELSCLLTPSKSGGYTPMLLNYIAAGVNSSGEIVGAVCPGGVPYGGSRACIATNSQGLTELVPSSAAMSVNGVVQQLDVGGCGFAADNELGTIATAVSESGSILVEGSGPIDVYSTELSCLLTPSKSGGYTATLLNYIAAGVNSSGEIVGAVCPGGVPYGGSRACIATNSQGLTELVPSSAAMSVNGVVQQLDVGGCGFAADNELGTIATAVSESGSILVEGSGPIDVYSTELSCLIAGPSIVAGQAAASVSASPALITLAPTQPANTALHSSDTGALDFFAGCQGASPGLFESNCAIKVQVLEATSFSGGHPHDDGNRPLGEIVCADDVACPSAQGLPGDDGMSPTEQPGNAWATANVKTVSTTAPVLFEYMPPQVGGDILLKITGTDSTGQTLSPVTQTIHVTIAQGTGCADSVARVTLCPLTAPLGPLAAYFTLTQGTPPIAHPDNHYGTPGFLNDVNGIAGYWFSVIQAATPLSSRVLLTINDMSLIDGGVFDFQSAWIPPHKGHRWGDAADIGSGNGLGIDNNLPIQYRAALLAYLKLNRYTAVNEAPCYPNATAPQISVCTHWHVQPSTP